MIDSTNIYSAPPLSPQQKESSRVSYWLNKLFNQEKEKNKAILNNISEDNKC